MSITNIPVPSRVAQQFHVHVNCFSNELPEALKIGVHNRDFKVSEFDFIDDFGASEKLWITSKKFPDSSSALKWYQSFKEQIFEDKSVRGYIECERLKSNWVKKIRADGAKKNLDSISFSLSKNSNSREADIHIFRDSNDELDELDDFLSQEGFYLVRNSKERIWTLLLDDIQVAKKIYSQLSSRLSDFGGKYKIELEEVVKLEPIGNFELRHTFS